MHVMQPTRMLILWTCMHTINASGWKKNTSCICACMITIRMSTSGVVHALPDNIIRYNYIIRIIMRQEWIEGAKVRTSISTSSKGWAISINTTVQNQGHSSSKMTLLRNSQTSSTFILKLKGCILSN